MSIRKLRLQRSCHARLLAVMAGAACNGAVRADAQGGQGPRRADLWRQPRAPGLRAPDATGAWSGIDVDYCRAVAAAVFNDPEKVQFMPLGVEERFDALKSGKVDVLAHNSTWTMSRETDFGLTFVGVNYYDGQGFLVHRLPEITSALELDGAKVCVQKGTTTIDNLEDYFKTNNLKYEAMRRPRRTTRGRITKRANATC